MSSAHPSIHIIALSGQKLVAGLISLQVQDLIQKTLEEWKKILLFYNRRAFWHAWICQDCGHFESCPDCDIALAYHSDPKPLLRCHHCSRISPVPEKCPHCQSLFSAPVGIGIQQVEQGLHALFPNASLYRIDSDMQDNAARVKENIDTSEILLSTQKWSSIQHPDIAAVVFVLFEVNFSVPSYDIEENTYHLIAYFKKQLLPVYVQTYIPHHPVLQSLVFENYKDFLSNTLIPERKAFLYPPFNEFVIIRIHHVKKERVRALVESLTDKIEPQLSESEIFFSADTDIWTRMQGQWNQKIILKGKWVLDILETLTPLIVRNRSIHIEWQ